MKLRKVATTRSNASECHWFFLFDLEVHHTTCPIHIGRIFPFLFSQLIDQTNSESEPERWASLTAGSPLLPYANNAKMATSMNELSLDDNDSTATMYRNVIQSVDDINLNPKVARVTFAPLPSGKAAASAQLKGKKGKGFRKDYSLGGTARCSSHMVVDCTPEQAFQSINLLKNHDFAFVKRSDGSYSYAILACRSLEPPIDRSKSPRTLEECMVFAMCNAGSTVKLRKNRWIESIRLISMEGLDPLRTRSSVKHQNQDDALGNGRSGDWVPPNVISFFPPSDDSISGLSSPSISPPG